MSYQIIFSKHFQRDFDDLEFVMQQRILLAIEKVKESPFSAAIKLKDTLQGKYRVRVGDYRIRFDVLETKVFLHRVGHRKDIYRV